MKTLMKGNNMNKTDLQQKRGFALICFFVLVAIAAIVIWLIGKDVQTTVEEKNAKIEEFYAPYWINDSLMHMNVSDGACVLFQIEDGFCYLKTNGIEHAVIDADTLKVVLHEDGKVVEKAIRLDTIKNLEYEDIFLEFPL